MKINPLLLLLAGGCAGYLAGLLQGSPGDPTVVSSGLQQRTEEFEPDCTMLKDSASQPLLLQRGKDYFTVLGDGKRFTVWGLNVEGDPVSTWWSAELTHALHQACKE